MNLQPHQKRVIDERIKVASDTDKLEVFTGSDTMRGLDNLERERLLRQLSIMQLYVKVLDERIAAF